MQLSYWQTYEKKNDWWDICQPSGKDIQQYKEFYSFKQRILFLPL
jgi:hypothetical protein